MLKVTPNFLRPGTGTSAPAEPYHNEKAVSYQSEEDGTSMADFEASPKAAGWRGSIAPASTS